MAEYLASDDILLNDPTLGRCWSCFQIVPLDQLNQVAIDASKEYGDLCQECLEKELTR